MLTKKALLLVQRVLYLHHFLQSSIPQNLGVSSKVTTLEMDSMFFFTGSLLRLQAVLRVSVKNDTVHVGYHYISSSSLGMICTNVLMNPIERITNTAKATFSGLPTDDLLSLEYIIYYLLFYSQFLMLIVKKLIACCLFLYTIASVFLQCFCLYFYLS